MKNSATAVECKICKPQTRGEKGYTRENCIYLFVFVF